MKNAIVPLRWIAAILLVFFSVGPLASGYVIASLLLLLAAIMAAPIAPVAEQFDRFKITGWWRGLLGFILFVAGIGSGPPPPVEPPKASASPTSEPLKTPEFKTIGGSGADFYAIIYDRRMTRPDVEQAMRAHCAGKQWCKVVGWDDPDLAATALPMTDRELAAERVMYTLNRASGMDEASWQK